MSEFVCEQFVRRYLMSHNYFRTLAAFDGESSSDNLNYCFQPSKIIDNISRAIADLDSETLGNIWKGLEDCFSSQLDRLNWAKFESLKAYTFKALLLAKHYLTCLQLHGSIGQEPAKHALFSRYFSKTWLDVLFVSLSNFLCVLFLSLPDPLKNDLQKGVLSIQSATHASLPRTTTEILDDFADLPAVRTAKQR
ncbi:WD repeat-containing protein 91 [Taenia crassiceps]|uniref:WD repeat-containing protein 91 n=1 Tax=Taenia crassiceps TaxID=6207 RepID=A0ABR4QT18_9CEST